MHIIGNFRTKIHSISSRHTKTHLAPGPRRRAFWRRTHRLPRNALAEYLALRDQFGDIVRLPAFPHPMYLLSHPDAIQYVLRDNARNYQKGVLFKSIAALQGQGLLTSEGALWRRQRRLAQPAFQQRQLATFGTIMMDEAQTLVQAWRHMAQTGEPINVAAWMHRLTFRVVGRALLGLAPDRLDDLGRQLQGLATQLMPSLAMDSPALRMLLGWIPTPRRQRFRQAVARYHTIAQQLIMARRDAMRHDDAQTSDVLAKLIAAQDARSGEGMGDQQLRDEIITFIGAGAETSALGLSWTWYLLDRYPEVAQRVVTEVDGVLDDRSPTPADLPNLPYSRMVLDEAMRLYPPSAVLPRQANADDTIGGYAVPRHAVIIMSPYVLHRHPDFWPEPEQFRPERFMPDQIAHRHRFAYIPFGEGRRVCIGRPFALMEMHLTLATIVQTYRLHLAPGRPPLPELAPTLRPRHGLWMTVHAR